MSFYGSWANEIICGQFFTCLVRTTFASETEHVDNEFSIENEESIVDFSEEVEYVE